jgi:hypothetical protein
VVEQGWLRLYDRKTGLRLLTHEESEAARRKAEAKAAMAEAKVATAEAKATAAEAKAAQELAARQAAETKAVTAAAEINRLREEMAKLRGQPS